LEIRRQARNIQHLFVFSYEKSYHEIIDKTHAKIGKIKAKIEERQTRIARLRKEYSIDDGALIQLLTEARKNAANHAANNMYSYSSTSNAPVGSGNRMEERTIGAGAVNDLLTENDFIESEKDQVKRLELVARNLGPITRFASGDGTKYEQTHFDLSTDELEFLGF
jgi:hypothetical protein